MATAGGQQWPAHCPQRGQQSDMREEFRRYVPYGDTVLYTAKFRA